MNAREHPVAGQPPNWTRRGHLFRRFDGTLVDRYMADEERADDARLRRFARAQRKLERRGRKAMAVRWPTLAQLEAVKARWFAFGAIATAAPILLVFALIWMLGGRG